MLFNSSEFLKFLLAFCLAYYLARNHLRVRNLLVIAASYLFYGWWDWRFLGLIVISTLLDYCVGLGLGRTSSPVRRRLLVAASVAGNLAILGFFKYYDFFVTSLAAALQEVGLPFHPRTLKIILPVGISFYTFQTMSYSLDVYRGVTRPTRDLAAFAAYVSFFPQLVAGPIERAHRLLPQFLTTRVITADMLGRGMWLLVWGMFKKVVIADSLGPMVDAIFAAPELSGPAVALGVVAFGIQIYCDFSGYSDIARGVARFFGFDLMVNFNLPYLARSVRDFWHRWHISLSTWLRDYLYIPLGGNRKGPGRTMVNIMITMLLGGLWHGAAWHYVLWGAWHGWGLCLERLLRPKRKAPPRGAGAAVSWALTMLFVFYGWLLFRAPNLEHAARMTLALGNFAVEPWLPAGVGMTALLALVLAAVEWPGATRWIERGPVRIGLQAIFIAVIAAVWRVHARPFIYFQF